MERRRAGSTRSRVGTAVFLSGAALLGVEITASRVLAPTFGSSLYVWGALIGVVLTGLAIGYWAGGVLADRWPSPYLFVGAIALGAVLVLADPRRRRVGARAGRLLGSRPAARPARRGDHALRPDERRARLGLADRRPARRPLASTASAAPPGASSRSPPRAASSGTFADGLLARSRVRHRPGARRRRGRAARRGGGRRRCPGALAAWRRCSVAGAAAARPRGRRSRARHDRHSA